MTTHPIRSAVAVLTLLVVLGVGYVAGTRSTSPASASAPVVGTARTDAVRACLSWTIRFASVSDNEAENAAKSAAAKDARFVPLYQDIVKVREAVSGPLQGDAFRDAVSVAEGFMADQCNQLAE